jgi:hypothetical protein
MTRKMDRYIADVGKRIEDYMTAAMEKLQEKVGEIIPIDTGKMWASRKLRKIGSGLDTQIVLGFSAPYTVYVHEDLSKAHGAAFNAKHAKEIAMGLEHTRRPQETAQFLLKAELDPQVQLEMRKAGRAKFQILRRLSMQ